MMESSVSVATGEKSGKALYSMDGDSPEWRGWHFDVHDGILSVTPPNGFCITDIPLSQVKFMQRICVDPPQDHAKPGRPAGRQAA